MHLYSPEITELTISKISTMRPDLSRIADFYHTYINQVPGDDLAEIFASQYISFTSFLDSIPAEKHNYRYADGKWTIKEVLQHVIDAERIFAYRALRFARKDHTPLPGFDENLFADNAKAHTRNWDNLVEEFKMVRRSSELLFNSFDKDQLESAGIAYNSTNYVLGLGFVTIGHSIHHQKVLTERYL